MGEGKAHLAFITFPVLLVERWLWQHMAENLEGAVPRAHAHDGAAGSRYRESTHSLKSAGGAQQPLTGLQNSQGMSNVWPVLQGRTPSFCLWVTLLLFCLSQHQSARVDVGVGRVRWEWVPRGSFDVQPVENARASPMAWADPTPSGKDLVGFCESLGRQPAPGTVVSRESRAMR